MYFYTFIVFRFCFEFNYLGISGNLRVATTLGEGRPGTTKMKGFQAPQDLQSFYQSPCCQIKCVVTSRTVVNLDKVAVDIL